MNDGNNLSRTEASPSMDILISSNLERLIFKLTGNDAVETEKLMSALKSEGRYEITDGQREIISDFYGNFATEEEDDATIKRVFDEDGYVLDTHTGVAVNVYEKYRRETGDEDTVTVIDSTASPYKFTRSVMHAIDAQKYDGGEDFELVDELEKISGMKIPAAIEEIRNAPVLHDIQCDADKMKDCVKHLLGMDN